MFLNVLFSNVFIPRMAEQAMASQLVMNLIETISLYSTTLCKSTQDP